MLESKNYTYRINKLNQRIDVIRIETQKKIDAER